MATAMVEKVGVNVPAQDLNGPQVANSIDVAEKYVKEKNKRLGRGLGQYVTLEDSATFGSLLDDPWIEAGTPINNVVPDGGHAKILVVGAGYGGILCAVNLIKSGFKAEDLLIVDPAGGFGGTWYYNRYPGLMCDVESYIYMPILEDMDYMPTRKYASGHELRLYGESICKKYGLHDRAMFQSRIERMSWDSGNHQWTVKISKRPKGGESSQITIGTEFALLATGLFNSAKLPNIEGGDLFKGQMLHTARWNYGVTGGSPADPTLTKLSDKTVAIVGTGATAIQVVPHLAKWSKELFIFQRTPSAVDIRGNRDTDASTWKTQIANKPGWQKARNVNYFEFLCNVDQKPKVDLVGDYWTRKPSYSALIGGPSYTVTPDNVSDHIARMEALDLPQQERVRQRAMQVVKDPETARKLQAWYPSWCKRPCFHDDYLEAFNLPHVKLIESDGKGVQGVSSKGIQFDGKEYPVDVIVWSTGYVSPGVGTVASKAGIELIGTKGQTLDQRYEQDGMSSLHGVATCDFPNLFFLGASQAGAAPNYSYLLEIQSEHIAHIIAEAGRKAQGKAIVEVSQQAEDEWAAKIVQGAATFASLGVCTPSYFNREGETSSMTVEQQIKGARAAPWARGVADYVRVIEAWREDGKLEGFNVSTCPR